MTVSSITPVNNYVGNGLNKTFDFDFPIENKNELIVTHIASDGTRTDLTCDLDYTIQVVTDNGGNFVSYGPSITFPIASSSYGILNSDEKISLALSLSLIVPKSSLLSPLRRETPTPSNLPSKEWRLQAALR